MSRYEAILFDLDGTLIQTHIDFPRLKKRVHRVLVEHHPSLELNTKNSTTYYLSIARKKDGKLFNKCMDIVEEEERLGLDSATIYPETKEALQSLKQKAILAIYTNNSKDNLDYCLREFKLAEFFDDKYVLSRNEVSEPKPSPHGILDFQKRVGLHKNKILFVGDSHVDEKAAIAAEVDFAYINRDKPTVQPDWSKKDIERLIDANLSKKTGIRYYHITSLLDIPLLLD